MFSLNLARLCQSATNIICLLAIAGVFIILWQRKNLKVIDSERRRLEAVAIKAREILANAPAGLMLSDHASGGFTGSPRLADLQT